MRRILIRFLDLFALVLQPSTPNQGTYKLGHAPDLSIFNRHAAMGFVIVPSQPFGYNYLGGKLLALLCCSHLPVRR